MTRNQQSILIGLCLCFTLGGCMNLKQPGYELSYYTLEYPPVRELDAQPLPVVIKVAPFSVAPGYDSHRMIYRDAPFKRNTYAYHRWRTPPGDLVSYRLRQDLVTTGLFAAVLTTDNNLSYDYKLIGTVDEFFEWRDSRSSKAILSVSITLIGREAETTGSPIEFHKSYRVQESFDREPPPALVDAMSLAMAGLSRQIITDLHHHITGSGKTNN